MQLNVQSFRLLNENGNEEWSLLQRANQEHVTSRQKYIMIKDFCKSRGVAFKDIRSHLLNRAKDAGLYRKTFYNKKGFLDYPPVSKLNNEGWYRALSNFLSWLSSNYVSYEKRKEAKAPKAPKVVSETSTTTITRKKDGTEVEKKKVTVETEAPKASKAPKESKKEIKDDSIVKPLDEGLSKTQIWSIIARNFSILGEFCKERNALDEFNELMLQLGLDDEMIEQDDFEGEEV